MKIYHHKVRLYNSPKTPFLFKNEFSIKEYNIAVENEKYIVLDDYSFTRLQKSGKSYITSVLDKEEISISIDDRIFGDHIYYDYYSTAKRSPKIIKDHIEKEIKKKYSWILGDLDLSIIK